MNENIMINNKKRQVAIFHSLMQVEYHNTGNKTLEQSTQELKELESQGKLKMYYPEVD